MHHGTCSDFNQYCPNSRLLPRPSLVAPPKPPLYHFHHQLCSKSSVQGDGGRQNNNISCGQSQLGVVDVSAAPRAYQHGHRHHQQFRQQQTPEKRLFFSKSPRMTSAEKLPFKSNNYSQLDSCCSSPSTTDSSMGRPRIPDQIYQEHVAQYFHPTAVEREEEEKLSCLSSPASRYGYHVQIILP